MLGLRPADLYIYMYISFARVDMCCTQLSFTHLLDPLVACMYIYTLCIFVVAILAQGDHPHSPLPPVLSLKRFWVE
jgi:hypothetical protein